MKKRRRSTRPPNRHIRRYKGPVCLPLSNTRIHAPTYAHTNTTSWFIFLLFTFLLLPNHVEQKCHVCLLFIDMQLRCKRLSLFCIVLLGVSTAQGTASVTDIIRAHAPVHGSYASEAAVQKPPAAHVHTHSYTLPYTQR